MFRHVTLKGIAPPSRLPLLDVEAFGRGWNDGFFGRPASSRAEDYIDGHARGRGRRDEWWANAALGMPCQAE